MSCGRRPGMECEMALDFLSQLWASAGRHAPGAGSGGARSGSPMAAAARITYLRRDRAQSF